jgi:hypothetical protein
MRTGVCRAARAIREAILRFGAPGRRVELLDYAIQPRPGIAIAGFARVFATGTQAYEQILGTIAVATDHLRKIMQDDRPSGA